MPAPRGSGCGGCGERPCRQHRRRRGGQAGEQRFVLICSRSLSGLPCFAKAFLDRRCPALGYSGAGFVLLQRMVEQKTGLPLAQYMDKEVFAPLGMKNSSYALSPGFELAAGHTKAGAVIPGKRNRYPESAAAGLYTNVLDLCRLVCYLNKAWTASGDIAGPLSKASTRTLLTAGPQPTMGRGFFIAGSGTNSFCYTHDGSNYGFKSVFKGYPQLGAGYAILANGDNMNLVNEIASAIRSVYGWA
ncbi:serine hydrolase domain-containing protein [Nonomuraea sp. NPDC003804]|uniref:serine hydrolase domain-containing protein n=1 Tax=Nonomuraea sp. NPDC003804 TaxID=3154547 RepID=UPI0033B5A8E9